MIDQPRLERAVHLDAERDGDLWRVSGGTTPHVVSNDGSSCDCRDSEIRRDVICKHRIAVLLRLGNPDVIAALRGVITLPPRSRKQRVEQPIPEAGALELWKSELAAGRRTMATIDDLRDAAIHEANARDELRDGAISACNASRRQAAEILVRMLATKAVA